MSKWGEPFVETQEYNYPDGRKVFIHNTYVDHYQGRPFVEPAEESIIDYRLLINQEISGDLSKEEATEILLKLQNDRERFLSIT